MIDSDLAWLACAVDGEGSVYWHLLNQPTRRKTVMVRVEVCNTDVRFVQRAKDIAQKIVGPDYKIGMSSTLTTTGKNLYRMNVQSYYTCQLVLRALIPWLINKKDRAEQLLCWIEHRLQGTTRRTGMSAIYTDEDRLLAEHLFNIRLGELAVEPKTPI